MVVTEKDRISEMLLKRRQVLTTASAFTTTLIGTKSGLAARENRFRAIAFDALAIFDPEPVLSLAKTLLPGASAEFSELWRIRQFEYTWLRSLMNQYADFAGVTDDALVFAANVEDLRITDEARRQLVNAYGMLKAWPDVAPVLKALTNRGSNLALLSNFTSGMLDGCIRASELTGVFDHVISTDVARTYKPDPRAYQLGVDAFMRRRHEILFVAFAGWDAAGAKSFGYSTFWLNRLNLPPEELGIRPDGTGSTLADLLLFLDT